jgi:hypothetical protein
MYLIRAIRNEIRDPQSEMKIRNRQSEIRYRLHHIYPKPGIGNRSEASIEYMKSRDKHKKLSSGG